MDPSSAAILSVAAIDLVFAGQIDNRMGRRQVDGVVRVSSTLLQSPKSRTLRQWLCTSRYIWSGLWSDMVLLLWGSAHR